MPKISVVMTAHNEAGAIGRAVRGVLDQTEGDFELLVVDDGSTDRTPRVLEGLQDPRISVIVHPRRLGISASRNEAIRRARGRYIAIHDADDLSLPERFRRQAGFLDDHPEIALCGSWGRMRDDRGRVFEFRTPVEPERIAAGVLRACPIVNSTLMARSEVLKRLLYDEGLGRAEDYDLFLRAARECGLANLPEFLVEYDSSLAWGYKIRDQYWKTRARWRAFSRHGYPWSQAFWLLLPLPTLLIPWRLKLALRRFFI